MWVLVCRDRFLAFQKEICQPKNSLRVKHCWGKCKVKANLDKHNTNPSGERQQIVQFALQT
jgi:hypothetical protein